MSAQIRILPQAEAEQGFGLLKDIVEMVKNPKAIDEAYERRLKAAKLTDDEVKKSSDARALIVQADVLRQELKAREDALEIAKTEHTKTVSVHTQNVQSENIRLTEWEARLHSFEEQLLASQIAQEDEHKKFEVDIQVAKDAQNIKIAELDIREQALKDRETANIDEAKRLTELSDKLKAKAGRLAAEAESNV